MHRSYSLKPDLEGKILQAHADIMHVLDDARKLVCDPTGNARDLLKQDDREMMRVCAYMNMYVYV